MAHAWGRTIQALHDQMFSTAGGLHAGAVPTRDEIAAWYAQFSASRLLHDSVAAIYQIPYGARLSAGLLLASLGVLLICKSYLRSTRPSQADVIRRVSRAFQTDTRPSMPQKTRPKPMQPLLASETLPVRILSEPQAEPQAGPLAAPVPPIRPLLPQAFLTADQFTQEHAPWAVPLGHNLMRIGRHQENDIRLEDKTVHRYHALLHRSPDGDFLIRDLSGQAGNGVYVNGSRIEQAALRPGDLVELGAVRLRFQQQRPS